MALKKTNLKDAIAQNGKAYDNANDKNKENVKMMFGFSPDMNKVKNAGKKPLRMTKAEALAYQEKLKQGKNEEENQVFDANKDMVIPSPVKSENKANTLKNNSTSNAKAENKELLNETDLDDTQETKSSKEEQHVVKQGEDIEKVIVEQAKAENVIRRLELKFLCESPNNVFQHTKELDPDLYNEQLGSIKDYGVIEPIIVRHKSCIETYTISNEYEILSGYTRFFISQELDLKDIPAIIVNVGDIEAVQIINDSNLKRTEREIDKCWAYRSMFEVMKKQGQRNDLKIKELVDGEDENQLCDNLSQSSKDNKRTTEMIAKKYNTNYRTVERKIRLTYLNTTLFRKYTRKEISQEMAIDLSYLDKDIQNQLCTDEKHEIPPIIFTSQNCKDLKEEWKKFEKERERGETKVFARNRYLAIMQRDNTSMSDNAKTEKALKPKTPKYEVDDLLFPKELKKKDRCVYISKALTYIKENNISLMEV